MNRRSRLGNFSAINRHLTDLRSDLSVLQQEIDELKPSLAAVGRTGDTDKLKILHKLHDAIAFYFDLDELHGLMYEIGVNPEERNPYGAKNEQTLDLVLYMRRQGRFIELVRALERTRPKVDWYGVIKNG